MKQAIQMVALSIAFTCIGLGTGWFAARQKKGSGGHGDSHGAAEPGHDEHAGHDHGPAKPKLSPQAIKNLGITLAEADTTVFWKYQAVPATVAEAPLSVQPLYAPIGGRVLEIKAMPGEVVAGGAVVLTILRDALPRPTLAMTDQILKPANEEFHRAAGELRKAGRGLELLKTELERIKKFAESGTQDGLPILPRKNLIDLQYEIARAEMDVQIAENELRRHGSTDEQIAGMAAGKSFTVLSQKVWKQALQQNGLWTPPAEALYGVLPAKIQELPWSVAAVGELAAAGLPLAELTEWFKAEPESMEHFLAIAALLQEGHSLAAVKSMHSAGGLEQLVRIKAPSSKDVPDWDLFSLEVKPGQKVEAGQAVGTLSNPRRLRLHSEPVGGETAAILTAAGQDATLEAAPLVPGTGPTLKGLKIAYVTNPTDGHGTLAVLRVDNEPLVVKGGAASKQGRIWKLRAGIRYILRVPTEKLDNVFVLPSAAVTDDGPDKVVFIQDGDSFKTAKVVISYQDHEFAVLDGKHSELFPGDQVVQSGAFGLGLALKAGSGAIDPHAGHQH